MIDSFADAVYAHKQAHQQEIDDFFAAKQDDKQLTSLTNNTQLITHTNGESELTILGSKEKDYHFYNKSLLRSETITELATLVQKTNPDSFLLPLLHKQSADTLSKKLANKLSNYCVHTNIHAVSPTIHFDVFTKKSKSYLRTYNDFKKQGAEIRTYKKLPEKIRQLHEKRWGRNRDDTFYAYLNFLLSTHATGYGLLQNGVLVSYIQIIHTGNTDHYYYSIYDQDVSGAGKAVLGYAMHQSRTNPKVDEFSFGRGAETYKYRYATHTRIHYAVKGFRTN